MTASERVEAVLARGFCESYEDHKAILEVARRTTGNADSFEGEPGTFSEHAKMMDWTGDDALDHSLTLAFGIY